MTPFLLINFSKNSFEGGCEHWRHGKHFWSFAHSK